MPATQTNPLADFPDRYDSIAGLATVLILGWAYLYAMQPIFGLLLTAAVGSAYAAFRIDDLEHGVVVAGLWGFVLAAFWFIGTYLSVGIAAVLAVVGYGRWHGAW